MRDYPRVLFATFMMALALTCVLAPIYPSLAAAAFDFRISISPTSRSVEQGITAYFPVTVTLLGGSGTVRLSVDPSFGSWAITPNVVAPTLSGQSVALYFYTSGLSPGTYTFRVKGERQPVVMTEPPVVRYSIYASLTVSARRTVEAFDFSLAAAPGSRWVEAGQSTDYDVTVTLVRGTAQAIKLTVSGLPSGARGYFVPSRGNPNFASKLYVETSSTTPKGTYPLRVKGETEVFLRWGPELSPLEHSTSVQLVVAAAVATTRPADFFDFTLSADPAIRNIDAGQVASYVVSINLVAGTRRDIELSLGNPAPYGAVANLPATTRNPTFTLNIVTDHTIRPSVYPLTIRGSYTPTGGSPISRYVQVTLSILPVERFEFILRVNPTSLTAARPGESASCAIRVDTLSVKQERVRLSVTALSGGDLALSLAHITCSLSVTEGIGTFISTLTVATTPDTPLNTYSLVVTGRGVEGGLTKEQGVTLTILPTTGIQLTVRGTIWAYGLIQDEWIPLRGVGVQCYVCKEAGSVLSRLGTGDYLESLAASGQTDLNGAYELTFGVRDPSKPPKVLVAVNLGHSEVHHGFLVTGSAAFSGHAGLLDVLGDDGHGISPVFPGLWVARGIAVDPSREMVGPQGQVTSVPWMRQGSVVYSAQVDFPLGADLAATTDALVGSFDGDFQQGHYENLPTSVKGEILRDLGYIYYWADLALKYHLTLIQPTSNEVPIRFHSSNPRTAWNYEYVIRMTNIRINIADADSQWNSRDAPKNTVWHELGHHLTYQLYGQERDIWDAPGSNHGGYNNPSSQDSLIEGLAEFISLLTASQTGLPRGEASFMYVVIDLELDWLATDGNTREEFAVASLLWDLFDDTPNEPFRVASTDPNVGVIRDEVHLSAEEILVWTIAQFQPQSVESLYESLLQRHPDKSQAITRLFIGHGFFEDRNGDGRHDSGEAVGSTYDSARGSRTKTPPIERSYILTNFKGPEGETVANVTIDVAVTFDSPYTYHNYQYQIRNVRNGELVYFTMPPKGYLAKANITATAPGCLRSKPLWIENDFYWKSLAEAKDEYFLKHTFELQNPQPSTFPNILRDHPLIVIGLLAAVAIPFIALVMRKLRKARANVETPSV